MKIFPAIDIKDGQIVRLFQGDYNKVTVYDKSPVEMARLFHESGAENLHVVDLDGAKDGALSNFETIKEIVSATDMFVEVGGGIRDEERIKKYLSAGVGRVILGTAAVNNFEFLTDMVNKYGDKIAVGVDAKDGFVAVDGWLTVTKLNGVDFCKSVRDIGVKAVIYTDIAKDGAMGGTNLDIYEELNKIDNLEIVASGGVSSMADIESLKKIGTPAAIIGKALYMGAVDLKEVLETARGE